MAAMKEQEFLQTFGFAYAAFLQTTGVQLLHAGDEAGMGEAMLDILKLKGLDPVGLTGVDIRDELMWFDGVLWGRGNGRVELFPAAALREVFGDGRGALAAILSAVPEQAPPGRFRRLTGARPRDPKRLYCFAAYWLAQNGFSAAGRPGGAE